MLGKHDLKEMCLLMALGKDTPLSGCHSPSRAVPTTPRFLPSGGGSGGHVCLERGEQSLDPIFCYSPPPPPSTESISCWIQIIQTQVTIKF